MRRRTKGETRRKTKLKRAKWVEQKWFESTTSSTWTGFVWATWLRSFPLSTDDLLCPDDELYSKSNCRCGCFVKCQINKPSPWRSVVASLFALLPVPLFVCIAVSKCSTGIWYSTRPVSVAAKPIENVKASPGCSHSLAAWIWIRNDVALMGRSRAWELAPPLATCHRLYQL